MKERTIWLKPGQEVEYCPYCHSGNVWPCEKGPLWTCQDCLHDFIVKHRAPEPTPKARAMSPEEFHALEQKAKEQEHGYQAPIDFTAPPTPTKDIGLKPDLGPRSKNPNSRICEVWVKGKYRELTTKDEPPSKDSLWELNNLVDIQETGIIGGRPIEQWIYPDGRPDNWGFTPRS